jgi:hypothetical protein
MQKGHLARLYQRPLIDPKKPNVLYPTLFSILMTDLANMLENSSIGANISSKLINCLLFADALIDPKKPNKEVFLKIYIEMQYPVKKIFGLYIDHRVYMS